MPPIGKAIGGVNFADLAVSFGPGPDGKDVLLKYGAFLQTVFEFLIVAFALFMVIKAMNKMKRPAPAAAAPPPPATELLLGEIRDLLKK
jgi:large conductance mechanosensitive channel